MLAAGGLLGLLLMGAAVSGLMSGAEDDAAKTDNDDDGAGTSSDVPGDGDTAGSGATWTGDFAEDGSLSAPTPPPPDDAPLAQLLFGDADGTAGSVTGDAGPDEDPFSHLDQGIPEIEPEGEIDTTAPAIPEAHQAQDTSPDILDIAETIPFPGGPDIPCVLEFDCETDRLILDFDGTEDQRPVITVDLDILPGNALVEANGTAVTLVEGAVALTPDHVDVVMSGTTPNVDPPPHFAGLTDGGTLLDELNGRAELDDHLDVAGGDALTGGIGDDLLEGGSTGETLFGNEGDDTLTGGAGNDALHGDDGADSLSGGEGVDFLSGGEGDDTLDGGGHDDLAFGGGGNDVIAGGDGNDGLQGGPGADTLLGGAGNDAIDGTFSHGLAYGGIDADGPDVIDGGDGDDTVRIGTGDDVTGGEGRDTFIAGDTGPGGLVGTIRDFDPEADQIEILYDPAAIQDPTVEIVDFSDGTGASVVLNGEPVLNVLGAQGLDPAQVILRATDTLPLPSPGAV
jgi:Ca2+-binding RTX toxin-like protein